MRIAVTSQNFRTVTGHAGRARRFMIFEAEPGQAPREAERLDLDIDMAIHGFDPRARHPLDGMDFLLTGGCGQGFINHLAARGVRVIVTAETDPLQAVVDLLAGRVKVPASSCGDGDGHGHSHDGGCGCHH
ncbi:MAG TPA: NifB/NifX family molybdenum-iron cluster-binding protein [Rhodocyclaceae bacterium]